MAETSQIQGAIYGTGTFGALRIAGAVAYGSMDVTTRRAVPFLGLGDIRGRHTSSGVSTRLEAGWRLEAIVPRVALTPSLAFQGSWHGAPGFSETAAGGHRRLPRWRFRAGTRGSRAWTSPCVPTWR